MKKNFILPDFNCLLKTPGISSDKIVIVSIVGKSHYSTLGLKAKSLGRIFSCNSHQNAECTIEGLYDEENRVIYLHLHSLLDTDMFVKQYYNISKRHQSECDTDDFLSIYNDVKSEFAETFLLLLHISHIVVISHPRPIFDINFIQYFKAVDTLSQNKLKEIVEALKCVSNLSPDWVINGRFCTPRVLFHFEHPPKGITNVKKVEQNLEDRVYHILKKTRIINTAGGCLFAIPLNDDYVYMDEIDSEDRLGDAVRGLIQDCQPGGGITIQSPFSCEPDTERSFKKFLQVHIHLAKTKGFDDTVSSRHHHTAVYFELPTLNQWIEATKILYAVIMKKEEISILATDTKFSNQRCLKVLPLALARYQEGLSTHYARAEHETRLAIAMALFRTQARGPMFHKYALKLEDECQKYWENGRQQCEAASLTGNPCKLPKHSSDQDHISGFIYKAVCDCGRKIGAREDPYNAKQANYVFYHQLSKECICSKLERLTFPVFEPSTKEFRAATLSDSCPEDVLSNLSDRSTQLTPDIDRVLVRQPSTTEYLPGMLTLNSPPGLLPVYSSWSLVCLGPSSIYSHNIGLSESYHPGFLSLTNYLLPWDVVVYAKSKPNWSNTGKYSSRGRRGRPTVGNLPQFTVKVFIGVEYECPSGHRFMLSAPDKMLKAAPGSIVKDTGHKVAESDMPLYYPCACRNGKVAQLMRLHVVTPKAPVHCTLDPRIQPASGAPIFISTAEGPTKLSQSAYWVMRLPYVYVSDKEQYQQNPNARLLQGVFGVAEVEP